MLELCRLYACTPLELGAQPAGVILDHLACLTAEHTNARIEERRAHLRKRR